MNSQDSTTETLSLATSSLSMIFSKNIAGKMAGLLLQAKAVKLNSQQPFTWSSGLKSPIYCDNRLTLSFPEIRTFIKEQFAEIIREKFSGTELIAAVATAGIAHGALVADYLETPFCYVRSAAKDHGLKNRIEGLALQDQSAVVVEDLISTGGSSLSVVEALRESGVRVIGMIAIFTYGFPAAEKKFIDADCPLFTLTDYQSLLEQALVEGSIIASELHMLQQWSEHPESWGVTS